jgi:hypothetical protein
MSLSLPWVDALAPLYVPISPHLTPSEPSSPGWGVHGRDTFRPPTVLGCQHVRYCDILRPVYLYGECLAGESDYRWDQLERYGTDLACQIE